MKNRYYCFAVIIVLCVIMASPAQDYSINHFASLPITIGETGIIVVIDGRVYCLEGEYHYSQWAQIKLPPLRELENDSLVKSMGTSMDIPKHVNEVYLHNGKETGSDLNN
ncbi:MAG: hypothetical protein JXB10_10150 [Pirellulales bacterium]|nr:hypothetical protein [Pirellulales bacterium]